METIIGLLFVLLPIIFKVIGKRLENAGKQEQAGKIREFSKKYLESESDDEAMEDIRQWFNAEPATVEGESVSESAAEPVVEGPVVPASRMTEEAVPVLKTQRKGKRKTPILLEEETEKKRKEKIDPKKLVIYSEIMKPKYTE